MGPIFMNGDVCRIRNSASLPWWVLALWLGLALMACTVSTPLASTPTPVSPTRPTPTTQPTPSAVPTLAAPGLPSDLLPIVEGEPERSGASSFPTPPDRDLYQLANQLRPGTDLKLAPRTITPNQTSYVQGTEETLWLVDLLKPDVYQATLELRLVTPQAYWWVEQGQSVSQQDLVDAAQHFEEVIYPRVTAAFGTEWSPGIDNDPHLNIIHASLRGAAGYFSSSDEYPTGVYPYSNQRETIYIDSSSLSIASQPYLEVLAHELQHAAHWSSDPNEDTWINEGLSELAVSAAGYRPNSIVSFMRVPSTSLVHWPLNHSNISAHYGGSSLFMHYLAEHYSAEGHLKQLVLQPADGIAGIDSYLASQGYSVTFRDVFADWIVANILDQDQGVYGYPELNVRANVNRSMDSFGEFSSEISQYGTEYIALNSYVGPLRIEFEAPVENELLPTTVGAAGCWWGNSGDSIASSLTRAVDLRGLGQATLTYEVWHNIEGGWDFGYVQVSRNEGRTWEILATPNTSTENPIGNSFGPGYTGDSRGWVSERPDLSQYTGHRILLRFQYITDDALNGSGICFHNIAIPEVGLRGDEIDWQAEGFVLTDNRVRQDFIVRVIQAGQETQVLTMKLDQNNKGGVVLPSAQNLDRLVVAVAPMAPKTLQPARYTLRISPTN